MSNVYISFFIVGFLSLLGITIYKLYNVMNEAKIYNPFISIILFFSASICWLFTLISFMKYPEELIYNILFIFSSLLVSLNLLFFIIEILYLMANQTQSIYKAYNSKENGTR